MYGSVRLNFSHGVWALIGANIELRELAGNKSSLIQGYIHIHQVFRKVLVLGIPAGVAEIGLVILARGIDSSRHEIEYHARSGSRALLC